MMSIIVVLTAASVFAVELEAGATTMSAGAPA